MTILRTEKMEKVYQNFSEKSFFKLKFEVLASNQGKLDLRRVSKILISVLQLHPLKEKVKENCNFAIVFGTSSSFK